MIKELQHLFSISFESQVNFGTWKFHKVTKIDQRAGEVYAWLPI